jgi:hypothetical protein
MFHFLLVLFFQVKIHYIDSWQPLLRNDKYSAKVFRYFVEYSDKESSKKSRVESHQHSSTGEVGDRVVNITYIISLSCPPVGFGMFVR